MILALSIIGALAVLAFVGAFVLRLARGRDDPATRGLLRGGVVLGGRVRRARRTAPHRRSLRGQSTPRIPRLTGFASSSMSRPIAIVTAPRAPK